MWKTFIHTEVLYDENDKMSQLFGLISLIPIFSMIILFVFVLVPTHLSRNAARLLIILTCNELACQILKRGFKSPRPLPPWDAHLVATRQQQLGHGMPSSHTSLMFCLATTQAMLAKNSPGRFQLWRYIVWLLALLVAVSRVFNGYHSRSQVVAGAAHGAFVAFLLIQIGFIKTLAGMAVRLIQSVSTL